jgi:hypothetical protein
MKIGAFEISEPLPELREPHALVMIKPWVDVGGVGSLVLKQMQLQLDAQPLGQLSRPGTFFDFTRYRPTVKIVEGRRVFTYPNSLLYCARTEHGPDLIFMHLLEPHAMAEDYVESIAKVLEYCKASVYCRIGSMYDSVPHTRPIVITGNYDTLTLREGVSVPLIQQRQSQYEGPTTIMNLLSESVEQMGLSTVTFMAHLPHYAQLEEDFSGTARMLEVLTAIYDLPPSPELARKGALQYAELGNVAEQQRELKGHIARLETYYDSTYAPLESASSESAPSPPLSPEIEQFLKDLDSGL